MRRVLLFLFLTVFGLGIGLAIGAILMRRVDRAADALAPTNLAGQAARVAGTVRERVSAAIDEGRRAAAQREAELRAEYQVPTVGQSLGRG